MAFPALATAADLAALLRRTFTSEDSQYADMLLTDASDAVRDAAGVVFTVSTTVVRLAGSTGKRLRVPLCPIRDVTDVETAGVAVTGWKLVDNYLWRACGWQSGCEPAVYDVTVEHGYTITPTPVAALVKAMAAEVFQRSEDGQVVRPTGLQSWRIDDAAESYATDKSGPDSYMYVSEDTRLWLQNAYGGGSTAVTGVLT